MDLPETIDPPCAWAVVWLHWCLVLSTPALAALCSLHAADATPTLDAWTRDGWIQPHHNGYCLGPTGVAWMRERRGAAPREAIIPQTLAPHEQSSGDQGVLWVMGLRQIPSVVAVHYHVPSFGDTRPLAHVRGTLVYTDTPPASGGPDLRMQHQPTLDQTMVLVPFLLMFAGWDESIMDAYAFTHGAWYRSSLATPGVHQTFPLTLWMVADEDQRAALVRAWYVHACCPLWTTVSSPDHHVLNAPWVDLHGRARSFDHTTATEQTYRSQIDPAPPPPA